jgi:hypothetical protein
MENAILTVMIIGLILGSLLGALVLKPLARILGKINNATFWNSFTVCFISTALSYTFWYFFGLDLMAEGIFVLVITNLVILSIAYIIIGKLIWKCTWIESFKANLVWIVAYSILMGFGLGKML